MNPRIRIFLIFLAIFSSDLFAANHYIRAGATGTGSGDDWTNATTSWPASFTRGDTYYVAAGSYPGKLFNTAHSGVSVITIKKATVADHGTNTGWSDAYATGQVAFTSGFEFRTGYWTIDGVTGGGAGAWSSNLGMKITETQDSEALIKLGNPTLAGLTGYDTAPNVRISHVEMEGKGSVSVNGGSYSNDGVANYGNDGFTLSYYWMHGIGRCPVYSTGRNMIIEHGWVESFYGSVSVHSEIASVWDFASTPAMFGSHTFRHNLFTHIWSTGGLMWDGADNASANFDVYGNTFYKPSGATWEVANGLIGGWSARNFRNARVYNNTFINVDQASLSSLPGTYSGNVAYNNLWVNSTAPNFSRFATHDYNRFINSGTTQSEPNGTSAASGNPFTDYVNFDFTLTGGTTSGISTLGSPFNVDPFGLTRGSDGTWDRGAYEFNSGGGGSPPAVTSALTATGATNSPFSYTLTCSNTPTTWSATGLPSGLSFNSGTQQITGTPVSAGTTNATVECSNASGSDTKTLVITINSAPTTPTFVQSATYANNAGSTTMAATFSSNNAVGNFIIVLFTWDGSATPTCSDSRGNSYTTLFNVLDTSANQSGGVCYAHNVAAGANTVTVTLSVSHTFRAMIASEYSGVATASAIDASANVVNVVGTTATDGYSSGAITTTASNETVWGGLILTNVAGTVSAGTGYTLRQTLSTSAPILATQDKTQASAGSVASTNTVTAASRYISAAVALKGPTPNPPAITSRLTETATAGTAYSYTVTCSNTPSSFSSSGLPSGLSFASPTISGTPTAVGLYSITIGCSNAAGSDSQTLTLSINPAIVSTGVLTDYLENRLVDHLFRGQPFTVPSTLYIGLLTSAPSDSAAGTEVSGTGYARVAVVSSLAKWAGTQAQRSTSASSGTSGTTSNNSRITFPAPTGSWGTVTHAGVYDAASGGHLLMWTALSASKTVASGGPAPSFPVSALAFKVAD